MSSDLRSAGSLPRYGASNLGKNEKEKVTRSVADIYALKVGTRNQSRNQARNQSSKESIKQGIQESRALHLGTLAMPPAKALPGSAGSMPAKVCLTNMAARQPS